ncbi:MAG: hypothetical protein NC936_00340 [Candidatus Omnitrophica bacterium]|nr:hypothetical protein [Candidatus Omnitrophota bacterium]
MITALLKLAPNFLVTHLFHDRKIGHLRRYNEETLLNKFNNFNYRVKNVYYSGHFKKVLVTSLTILGLHKERWDRWCEECDRKKERKKYIASNVCVIFERL